MRTIVRALVLTMSVAGIATLSVAQTAQKPQFEVVSIRQSGTAPSGSGERGRLYAGACGGGSPIEVDSKRFTATLTPLRLIALANGKKCWAASEVPLISGGPAWIRSDMIQIQSVIPDGFPAYTGLQLDKGEAPELQSMLQAMLADRFKLVLHRETREVPVYNLVLVQGGKVKLSDDQTPPVPFPPPSVEELRERSARGGPRPPQQRGTYSLNVNPQQGNVSISASAIPMSMFINLFQGQEGRVVIDKTGLTGLIDISSETMTFEPSTLSEPSMWPQIVARLGMRLEPTKGPAEVLVIDSVQKPTEN